MQNLEEKQLDKFVAQSELADAVKSLEEVVRKVDSLAMSKCLEHLVRTRAALQHHDCGKRWCPVTDIGCQTAALLTRYEGDLVERICRQGLTEIQFEVQQWRGEDYAKRIARLEERAREV